VVFLEVNDLLVTIHHHRCARSSASSEERRSVCDWCVDMIYRHLCLMNSMCKGVVTEGKLQRATIGLLYMLRQGIVVHELVVLPKLQVSSSCLYFI